MLHSDTPASALSSTELSVSNLGITLLYSQSSSLNNGGSSGGGSTPVEPPISCFTYLISNNTVVIKGYDSINCPPKYYNTKWNRRISCYNIGKRGLFF